VGGFTGELILKLLLGRTCSFHGGQGSANTSGWAPDSKKIVWSVYEKLPAEPAK
jgi:hypothetical protein